MVNPLAGADLRRRTSTKPSHFAPLLVGTVMVVAFGLPSGVEAEEASPSFVQAPALTTASRANDLVIAEVHDATIERGGAPGVVAASVANNAASPATNVVVTYRLPSGVDHVEELSSSGCTTASRAVRNVVCSIDVIEPGESASLSIGVGVSDPDAVIGARTGTFAAPTSDGFSPLAGQIRMRTWYHEAGREGTALTQCWPLSNPSPAMAVAGSSCVGVDGIGPRPADEETVLDSFPEPFSAPLVRSWEWDTAFTASQAGTYKLCSTMLDDGAYVAIAPFTAPLTDADIVHEVDAYGRTPREQTFTLGANTSYRLLMRVSNRGIEGVDNGNTGGGLAGWGTIGIVAAERPCSEADTAFLGNGPGAWVQASAANAIVRPATAWFLTGLVEGAARDERVPVSVRLSTTTTAQPSPTVTALAARHSVGDDTGVVIAAECTAGQGVEASGTLEELACGIVTRGAETDAVVSFEAPRSNPARELFIESSSNFTDRISWAATER